MNLNNPLFDKKEEFTDGKYSVYSFSNPSKKFRRISCEQESICLLPFEINENSQISNVYLFKYEDYLLGGSKLACITDTFDKDQFDSQFSAVEHCLEEKLGISNVDLNDCYFLGNISHGIPFSKEYRCYAVNVTSAISEKSVAGQPVFADLEKIKFSKVANGQVPDSLVLSCSLLLLSYFSE